AELSWTVQLSESQQKTVRQLPLSDEVRFLRMKRGLLVQHLELADSGLYTCSSQEHSYSQVLGRYRVHIIPNHSLHVARYLLNLSPNDPDLLSLVRTGPTGGVAAGFLGQSEDAPLLGHRNSWLPPLRSYKDLEMVGTNSLSMDEYCEHLWYREKCRQQKLHSLKLRQDCRKARVRRTNPSEIPL
ncbi:hypothetical protein GOODEAATRI_034583, partial [Goodea atripinnis]